VSDPAARLVAEMAARNGQVEDAAETLRRWCDPLDWAAFLSEEDQAGSEWAVEPVVPTGAQVAIWARAGVGKSLLALDTCASRATGSPVLGGPALPAVDVLYFDMENPADAVRTRVLDLGYTAASDLSRFHYFHIPSLPPLDGELGGAVVAALVERFAARLVVVDTTASTVAGKENDADTYRGFYRHTGRRLRALGASLVRLDHSGKDRNKGQRGSSAKDDDMDVVFEMSEAGDGLVLRRTKSRFPWVPREVRLHRETEPALRHVLAPSALPEGTVDLADLLDDLGVAIDTGVRDAQAVLREAGQGRRHDLVSAALKYRRRPR
jgi:RecA-family ATPase